MEAPPPPDPVTLLPDNAGKSLARKLISDGHERLSDVPEGMLTGKDALLYRRIRAAHIQGKAILEPHAGEYLRGLPYPRYYFDFEAIDLAVPIWADTRPFQQVPFQWSCHIEDAPGSFRHAEFLDTSGADPSRACAESLIATLGDNAGSPIFVYYKTYEDSRLRELADRFPDLREALYSIRNRLVDLLPLTRGSYYHPGMEGSFSIKKVLPTMSSLSYDTLDGVQDGEQAQIAYLDAAIEKHTADGRRIALREQLLTYCRQDTWAMVLIGYHLMGETPPEDVAS
jgi:hypothetical protein